MLKFNYHPDVEAALAQGAPVLALESTILAHGMPRPGNLVFARELETLCRDQDCVPATIAIIDGQVHIGLDDEQLERVCFDMEMEKVAIRDLPVILARGESGATTVSSTMHLAHAAGIKVFATGGIGGVHRDAEYTRDVSSDLTALSQFPLMVVSAGAKAILDLPQTLEALETLGVTVIGYGTSEFPAFYSRSSGLSLMFESDNVEELVEIHAQSLALGRQQATLIANPIPAADEIPRQQMEQWINEALAAAHDHKIKGKDLTPFLLQHIVKASDGNSLAANQQLARNNIRLGIDLAKAVSTS